MYLTAFDLETTGLEDPEITIGTIFSPGNDIATVTMHDFPQAWSVKTAEAFASTLMKQRKLVSWNGARFDFPVLAKYLNPHMKGLLLDCLMGHYDLMLNIMYYHNKRISLADATMSTKNRKPFGGGAQAAADFKHGRLEALFTYSQWDTQCLWDIARIAFETKQTGANGKYFQYYGGILTVGEILEKRPDILSGKDSWYKELYK